MRLYLKALKSCFLSSRFLFFLKLNLEEKVTMFIKISETQSLHNLDTLIGFTFTHPFQQLNFYLKQKFLCLDFLKGQF